MNKNNKTFLLTFSAVMIALSTALSFVKIWKMPLGGSVTLLSMLPVCMIGILYGTKKAVAPCVLYAVIQMLVDGIFAWGLTPVTLAGSIVFDYLLAYGALSLAGIGRKRGTKGIYTGICAAMLTRFVSHFFSGVIFFKCFDYFGGNIYLYSLCYNGAYMLPEMLLTLAAAFILLRMESVKRMILQ